MQQKRANTGYNIRISEKQSRLDSLNMSRKEGIETIPSQQMKLNLSNSNSRFRRIPTYVPTLMTETIEKENEADCVNINTSQINKTYISTVAAVSPYELYGELI